MAKAILPEDFVSAGCPYKQNVSDLLYNTNSRCGGKGLEEIYKSTPGDFLGESQVTIYREYNELTKSSQAVAKFVSGETLTSENIINLIGQNNYDNVFTALCSVISQEFRVKSILGLLTRKKVDKSTQFEYITEEDHPLMDEAQRITMNVKDTTKHNEVLRINKDTLESVGKMTRLKYKLGTEYTENEDLAHSNQLQEDDIEWEEDSVGDICVETSSTLSNFSFSFSNLTDVDSRICQGIDNFTEAHEITVANRTITLPFKPKDHFHYVSKENLSKVSKDVLKFLYMHQLSIDYKHCLDYDASNMLPIHQAVIDDDAEVVSRHSVILRDKAGTVDQLADGDTPLHLAIGNGSPVIVKILLSRGASISLTDSKVKNALHLAAELDNQNILNIISEHCDDNPSYVRDELEQRLYETDLNFGPEELKLKLMENLCSQYDNQGCTPLMIACRMGKYQIVKILVKLARATVNYRSPMSGETALFQTVANACLDASKRGKDGKISEAFMRTIQVLLDGGAASIANFSGTTINQILATEYNYPELVMLLQNQEMYQQLKNTDKMEFNKFIIIKGDNDKTKVIEVKKDRPVKPTMNNAIQISNNNKGVEKPKENKSPILEIRNIKDINATDLAKNNDSKHEPERKTGSRNLTKVDFGALAKNKPQVLMAVTKFVEIAPKPAVSPTTKSKNEQTKQDTNNSKQTETFVASSKHTKASTSESINVPLFINNRRYVCKTSSSTSKIKYPKIAPKLLPGQSYKLTDIISDISINKDSKLNSNVNNRACLQIKRSLVPFDKDKVFKIAAKRKTEDVGNTSKFVKILRKNT